MFLSVKIEHSVHGYLIVAFQRGRSMSPLVFLSAPLCCVESYCAFKITESLRFFRINSKISKMHVHQYKRPLSHHHNVFHHHLIYVVFIKILTIVILNSRQKQHECVHCTPSGSCTPEHSSAFSILPT